MKRINLKFWKNPKQKFSKYLENFELAFEFAESYKKNNFSVSLKFVK